MNDCIFCKIIEGQLPAEKIYEDKDTLAFLDINPVNPGHTLVVPKKHFKDMLSVSPELLKKIIITVQKIAPAVMKGTGAEGFNLGCNNMKAAGQIVPHLHFHIMPRFMNDGYKLWRGKSCSEKEFKKAAKKIKEYIQ